MISCPSGLCLTWPAGMTVSVILYPAHPGCVSHGQLVWLCLSYDILPIWARPLHLTWPASMTVSVVWYPAHLGCVSHGQLAWLCLSYDILPIRAGQPWQLKYICPVDKHKTNKLLQILQKNTPKNNDTHGGNSWLAVSKMWFFYCCLW